MANGLHPLKAHRREMRQQHDERSVNPPAALYTVDGIHRATTSVDQLKRARTELTGFGSDDAVGAIYLVLKDRW